MPCNFTSHTHICLTYRATLFTKSKSFIFAFMMIMKCKLSLKHAEVLRHRRCDPMRTVRLFILILKSPCLLLFLFDSCSVALNIQGKFAIIITGSGNLSHMTKQHLHQQGFIFNLDRHCHYGPRIWDKSERADPPRGVEGFHGYMCMCLGLETGYSGAMLSCTISDCGCVPVCMLFMTAKHPLLRHPLCRSASSSNAH